MNRNKLRSFYRKAIALIYPNVCPFCNKIIGAENLWCESCAEFLPYVRRTPIPPENVSRLYSCCYYMQRARYAVHSLKFGGQFYIAEAFGMMMSGILSDEMKNADMLVPVPSGFMSVKKRGFAPAEMLAKTISVQSGVPVVKALKARDDKLDQKELNSKERIENAKNSFSPNDKCDLCEKKIILIDDVCTTGSTLSAAAGILLNAGAKEVVAAVFAKTISFTHYRKSTRKYKLKNRG